MTLWDTRTALSHIKKHFLRLDNENVDLLFADFPNAFDNFALILQMPNFRIRFKRDRSEITIQIGTNQAFLDWSMGGWYELTTIILFLTNNQFLMVGSPEDKFNADKQLEKFSKVYYYYNDLIVELFKPDFLQRAEEKLHLSSKYMQEIICGKLKKDYDGLLKQSTKYWDEIAKAR